MAQRLNTTLKRIVNHYEIDKQGTPKFYACIDSFNIVMNEFGGKLEYTTPDNYLADNGEKNAEYSFGNGLKVWAGFNLNEFKQYQLNHVVFGS